VRELFFSNKIRKFKNIVLLDQDYKLKSVFKTKKTETLVTFIQHDVQELCRVVNLVKINLHFLVKYILITLKMCFVRWSLMNRFTLKEMSPIKIFSKSQMMMTIFLESNYYFMILNFLDILEKSKITN
jgi:hypothetical protein